MTDTRRPRAVAMDGCQYEQAILIQQSIDTPPIPPISPLECLNLNIIMPDVDIAKPLPVMVFIHGGGFVMGGNWWPQYDSSRLVKLSMGIDMPIIAVNIG
jgi:carboxylesterase type B